MDLAEFIADDERMEGSCGYASTFAWLAVLLRRRAARSLRALQLQARDVVAPTDELSEEDIVSSIGGNGRVYFKGPNCRTELPHRLKVILRADDLSESAELARERVRNLRAPRDVNSGSPGVGRLRLLSPFKVRGGVASETIELLRSELDKARDERPLQRFLSKEPSLLGALLSGNHGRYVLPKVKFGERYESDFLLADLDSAGFYWTLVEVESPTAQIATKGGRLAAIPRHAVDQILDWRRWLTDNLDTARRSRDEHGLGLPGIRPDAPGLVIVGRRRGVENLNNNERNDLRSDRQIRVQTWDWLVENVDGAARRGLKGPLDWRDRFELE